MIDHMYKANYKDKSTDEGVHIALWKSEFDRFEPSLLGLGDIRDVPSGERRFDAVAAVYDLEGFTSFCDRRDPHLIVPVFLDKFIRWIFDSLKQNFCKSNDDSEVLLWGYLPVFAKFMGDGLLIVWDIPKDERHGGALALGNILVRIQRICSLYRSHFLPTIENDFTHPPLRLRCGGAVGSVISVGNIDFVGSCINLASRLQKVGALSFAFAQTGCDPQKCLVEPYRSLFKTVRYKPRGFEKEELILVNRQEYYDLSEEERGIFSSYPYKE